VHRALPWSLEGCQARGRVHLGWKFWLQNVGLGKIVTLAMVHPQRVTSKWHPILGEFFPSFLRPTLRSDEPAPTC
jgi:hypothetical protein